MKLHKLLGTFALAVIGWVCLPATSQATIVRFDTILGSFDVQLFDTQTPQTVANFLTYVNAGAYDDDIFHRSTSLANDGLQVLQGGGFTYDGTSQTDPNNYPAVPQLAPPVQNEPGISNTAGTIAVAKLGGDPNSGTSQFYFNISDNSAALDPTTNDGGFTVFGKVLGNGLSILNQLAALPTFNFGGNFTEAPLQNYTTANFNSQTPVTGNNLALLRVSVVQPTTTQFTVKLASSLDLLKTPLTTGLVNRAADKSPLETSVARDTPFIQLTNNSSGPTLTSFSIQINDPNNTFDAARLISNTAGISITGVGTSTVDGKTSKIVNFALANGLASGDSLTVQLAIDPLVTPAKLSDFRQTLFTSEGGADTSNNAQIVVDFSDGSSISATLPNLDPSDLSDDLFTFQSQQVSTEPTEAADTSIAASQAITPDASPAISGNLSAQSGSITAVPEPGAFVLCALGLVGLCWKRRRARS